MATSNGSTAIRDKILASLARYRALRIGKFPCAFWRLSSRPGLTAFEYLFKVEHGITIDPACKDILRLCFTSYDPDYFINDDAVEIDVNAMDLPAINNVFESPDNDLPVQNIPSLVAVPDAHPWTAERIKEVIKHIPSEDYDQWIMVGMAIYHSGANGGFSVWDEWSKTSKKYNKTEIFKKWCSFDNGDSGQAIKRTH